jgi:hypothetical protein
MPAEQSPGIIRQASLDATKATNTKAPRGAFFYAQRRRRTNEMKQYIEVSSGELELVIRDYLDKIGVNIDPESPVEIIDGKVTVLLSSENKPPLMEKLKEVVDVAANLLDIRAPKEMDSAGYYKVCLQIINKIGTTDSSEYKGVEQ